MLQSKLLEFRELQTLTASNTVYSTPNNRRQSHVSVTKFNSAFVDQLPKLTENCIKLIQFYLDIPEVAPPSDLITVLQLLSHD